MEAGNPAGDAAADARLLKSKRLETWAQEWGPLNS